MDPSTTDLIVTTRYGFEFDPATFQLRIVFKTETYELQPKEGDTPAVRKTKRPQPPV